MSPYLDEVILRVDASGHRGRLSGERLAELMRRFGGRRVLVIGDLMLDEYVWGEVTRVSPEAPVPVVQAREYTYRLGGAGNVAANIQALGGSAVVAGVVGADSAGDKLAAELAAVGADTAGVLRDPHRPTTLKTRVVAHSQQVVRIDRESRAKIDPEITSRLLVCVNAALASVDAVLVSDYDKGVIGPDLVRSLIGEARRLGKMVAVNPKPFNLMLFRGAHLITMNLQEAQRAANMEIGCEETLNEVGRSLLDGADCDALMITRGPQGVSLFERGASPLPIPTLPSEVYDVTGAGDTVISVAATALAAGATYLEAAALGNAGGSLKVKKLGAAAVTAAELLAALNGHHAE